MVAIKVIRCATAHVASHLILDLKDPGVADLVKNWTIGESYKAEVEFTYDVKSPASTSNTVTSIVDESAPPPDEEAPPAPPPKGKKKPAVPISY